MTKQTDEIYRTMEEVIALPGLDAQDKALLNSLLDVLERSSFSDLPEWAADPKGYRSLNLLEKS